MSEALTIDEMLAEISAAAQGDEGHTTEEWAEQMGCSQDAARRKIKRLIKAGKMKHGLAPRTSIRGRVGLTDVYRLV